MQQRRCATRCRQSSPASSELRCGDSGSVPRLCDPRWRGAGRRCSNWLPCIVSTRHTGMRSSSSVSTRCSTAASKPRHRPNRSASAHHARAADGMPRGVPRMRRHGEQQAGEVRGRIDPRTEGSRAGKAAAGHVHAYRKPAAHRAGGDRQRGGRSARRLRQAHRADLAQRRLGERRRRRPRHPVRTASRREGAGARDRLHALARRRQVRQGRWRRLQLFRRVAWRRRQRHQRLGAEAGGDGVSRRPGGDDRVQRRRCRRAAEAAQGHAGRSQARHVGARLAGCEVFRCGRAAEARADAPAAQQGRADAGRHGGVRAREDRRDARAGSIKADCATT